MLAIERRKLIISKLEAEGKVIVSELAKEFDITEETVRRDLEWVEGEGLATKIYGGAILKTGALDIPYNIRKSVNVEEKKKIAEKIAERITDGDRIMLDASSTAIYVIKSLKNKKNITVITNSVEILLELADKPDWTVLSSGGVLKDGGLSLNGSSAERMIRSYHVNYGICSCKGLDMELGVTDSNEKDCQIKQAIYSSAEKKILAIDGTKFDRKSFVKVCDAGEVDIIATNQKPPEAWVEFCRIRGIELVY